MENSQGSHKLHQLELMLNALSRDELVLVNRMAVQRVKLMDELNRFAANSQFYPGQRVEWKDQQGLLRRGVIIRVNTKTISIKEDGDLEGMWKVSASILARI